jgi:hypothetical protein
MKKVSIAIGLALLVGCQSTTKTSSSPMTAQKPDPKTLAAYDQFKNLNGQWRGKSSKGWVEELNTETIADGTCVMELSRFAHGEGTAMATAYTMDKVNFHFIDKDHYKSQWAFYRDGKEAFMEEIEYERTVAPAPTPAPKSQ